MVIHQAFGHAVLAGNPDAIQVERNTRKDRVRTRSQARTCSAGAACCCAVCRPANSITVLAASERRGHRAIVKGWVEVPHPIVGFIRVGSAIPAKTEV